MIDSIYTDPEFIAAQIQAGASEAFAVEAIEATAFDAVSGGNGNGASSSINGSFAQQYGTGYGQGGGTGGDEPPRCFVGETLILMADGTLRRIDRIKIGDSVSAFDERGEIHAAKVLHVFVHDAPKILLDVETQVSRFFITPEHRVWQGNADFTPIGELQANDFLFAFSGEKAVKMPILSAEWTANTRRKKVYNIEVETYRTYIANGVFVHNLKPIGGNEA